MSPVLDFIANTFTMPSFTVVFSWIGSILILSVSPLLLPMRGLLAGKARSCAWAAYISLLYFIHGSVEAYANPLQRPYALLEVTFSLMLFVGASLYVRYHKKKP